MTSTLHQSKDVLVITRGEQIDNHTAILTDMLFGDTVSGTPTVAETTSLGLVCGSCTVNVASTTVEGRPVAAGQAVQFSIDARSATVGVGVVRVTFNMTTGGGPRTFDCRVEVVA